VSCYGDQVLKGTIVSNKHNKKQVVKNLFSLSKLLAEAQEHGARVHRQTDHENTSFTELQTSSQARPGLEQPLAGDGSAG